MASVKAPFAVTQALDRYRDALRQRFGSRLRELVLFGSYARGDAREDSDVDVLVTLDDLSDSEFLDVIDMAYWQGRAIDDTIGLSPLVYSTTHAARMRAGGRRLFRDIDTEGVRL